MSASGAFYASEEYERQYSRLVESGVRRDAAVRIAAAVQNCRVRRRKRLANLIHSFLFRPL